MPGICLHSEGQAPLSSTSHGTMRVCWLSQWLQGLEVLQSLYKEGYHFWTSWIWWTCFPWSFQVHSNITSWSPHNSWHCSSTIRHHSGPATQSGGWWCRWPHNCDFTTCSSSRTSSCSTCSTSWFATSSTSYPSTHSTSCSRTPLLHTTCFTTSWGMVEGKTFSWTRSWTTSHLVWWWGRCCWWPTCQLCLRIRTSHLQAGYAWTSVRSLERCCSAWVQHSSWEWNLDLPYGQKAVGSGWVFKVKQNQDGSIERFKARLVAKGYSQRPGLDYNESFAPTFCPATLLAAVEDLELCSVDITSAFTMVT